MLSAALSLFSRYDGFVLPLLCAAPLWSACDGRVGASVPVSTGVPDSYVHGSLHDGVFQGRIETPDASYYVEKAHHYYPRNHSSSFHSVIYSEEHIEDPYQHLQRGKGETRCKN